MLILDRLRTARWVDTAQAATAIQRTEQEAAVALAHLEAASAKDSRVVRQRQLPRGMRIWTPTSALPGVTATVDPGLREGILIDYATSCGVVTSTIAMHLTGVTRPTANADLAGLVEGGLLNARGAGPTSHFTPA